MFLPFVLFCTIDDTKDCGFVVTELPDQCGHSSMMNTTFNFKKCAMITCSSPDCDDKVCCRQGVKTDTSFASCPRLSPLAFIDDSECSCLPCSGIRFELVGRVRDGKGHPIVLATVSVVQREIATFSQEDGLFSFTLTIFEPSLVLQAQAAGYRTARLPVVINPDLHRTNIVNITLHREDIQVLNLPDQAYFLLFVTEFSGSVHASVLEEEEEVFDINGNIVLQRSSVMKFVAAQFALVFNVSNSLPFRDIVLQGSECPNTEHPMTDIVNNFPLHLLSEDGLAIHFKSLFKISLYDYSNGELINLESLIKNVLFIHPISLTGKDLFATPYHGGSEVRRYRRLASADTPSKLLPINSTSEMDGVAVVWTTWQRTNDGFLPEFFLIGSEVSTCFVPVIAIDCANQPLNLLVAGMGFLDGVAATLWYGHTPLCIGVPCPDRREDVAIVLTALQDTSIPLLSAPIYVGNDSNYIYSTQRMCLGADSIVKRNIGTLDGSHFVTLFASKPRSFFPILASTDTVNTDLSLPDSPYSFLQVEVTHCPHQNLYITLTSKATGEVTVASTDEDSSAVHEDLGMSGMGCGEVQVFCLPFAHFSDLLLTFDVFQKHTTDIPNCVLNQATRMGKKNFDVTFDNQQKIYDLRPTTHASEMIGVFFSANSRLIAYSRCLTSSTPAFMFTCTP